jgi:hypothetical protein
MAAAKGDLSEQENSRINKELEMSMAAAAASGPVAEPANSKGKGKRRADSNDNHVGKSRKTRDPGSPGSEENYQHRIRMPNEHTGEPNVGTTNFNMGGPVINNPIAAAAYAAVTATLATRNNQKWIIGGVCLMLVSFIFIKFLINVSFSALIFIIFFHCTFIKLSFIFIKFLINVSFIKFMQCLWWWYEDRKK